MERAFRQVDVFGTGACTGNPVAVVLDAEGIDEETMRRFSVWSNLSECTFVLPPSAPGADYRVRIFALNRELPFAGHPTLGTARAWLDAGGTPIAPGVVFQECDAGLVPCGSTTTSSPSARRRASVQDTWTRTCSTG